MKNKVYASEADANPSVHEFYSMVSQAEDVIWMAINRLEEQLVQHPSQALWMDQYLAVLYDDLKIYIRMAAKVDDPIPRTREPVAVMH